MNRIITPGHPHFHIHKRNYIELEAPAFRVGVEGRYVLERIKPGHGVIQELSFPNLVTDFGMNALGSGEYNPMYIHVGTSTTPPANSNTSLGTFGTSFSLPGTGDDAYANSGAPDYYAQKFIVKKSEIGAATGNWTEIAVSNQAETGNIYSRALILDSGGNPTTFTVLADEQMQASYELRHYPIFTDDVRNVTISGVTKSTITRVCNASNWRWYSLSELYSFHLINCNPYTGDLNESAVSGLPAGDALGQVDTLRAAYGSNNFYRDASAIWAADYATGTHRTYVWGNSWSGPLFQVQYNTPIVKGSTQQLVMNQRYAWARR